MDIQQAKQLGIFVGAFALGIILLFGDAFSTKASEQTLEELPLTSESSAVPPDNSTIRIDVDSLPPDGKIQLGAFPIKAGVTCTAQLSWEGAASLMISCQSGGGRTSQKYPLASGVPVSFTVPADGKYSFPIQNTGPTSAGTLQGTIRFSIGPPGGNARGDAAPGPVAAVP